VVASGATLQLQGGVTVTGEALTISGVGVAGAGGVLVNASGTNTWDGSITLGANSTVFSAGGVLQLGAGAVVTGSGVALTFDGGGVVNVGAALALGTGGSLVKSGTGSVVLQAASTYTGVTTVNGGTLAVTADGALGTAGGNTVVTSGAVLDLRGVAYTGAEPVNLGGATIAASTGVSSFAGLITLTTGGGTFNVGSGAQLTLSGAVGGTTAFVKSGTGTLVLGVANTHTSLTTVNAGVLSLQSGSGLGGTTQGTVVAAGASLELQGGTTVGAEALTISGTGFGGTGALRNKAGNNTYGGLITLGANARVVSDAGTLTLSNPGNITGSGLTLTVGGSGNMVIGSVIATGTGALVKEGAGTLVLTAGNTFTGGATVKAGSLQIGNAGTTGGVSGAVLVESGARLVMQRSNAYNFAATLSGVGTIEHAGTGVTTFAGSSPDFSGAVLLNAGTVVLGGADALGSGVLTFGGGVLRWGSGVTADVSGRFGAIPTGVVAALDTNGNDVVFASSLSGSGSLTKRGGGALELAGNNGALLGGMTVEAGTLRIGSAEATGSAPLVLAGGRLSGSDVVTARSVANAVSVTGSVTLGDAVLAAPLTLSGSVNLAGSAVLSVDSAVNLVGSVTETGGSRAFSRAGLGLLSLGAAGSYTGDTVLTDGVTRLGVATAIPSGSGKGMLVMDGGASSAGVLDLAGFAVALNGVNGASGSVSARVLNDTTGTEAVLTVGGANGTSSFAGVIADNSGLGGTVRLRKVGSVR
jgi:autotransporter-associated beta strand protein